MKKLLILITLTLILFLSFTVYIHQSNKPVTATKQTETASKQQLITYDYVITGKDNQGYYGHSLNDDTNIFLVQSNLPEGMKLNKNDCVRVSFPNNSYEQITSVQKLENNH